MDVLHLLVYFVVFLLVCGIIYAVTGMSFMPPFARQVGYVLMLVVALILVLNFAGGGAVLHTRVTGLITGPMRLLTDPLQLISVFH